MKIAHEAPIQLMNGVRRKTDFDYALVHLFDNEEYGAQYFDYFWNSLIDQRELILDNSIFELGKHFDIERYRYWIKELEPTYYILPDVLDDMQGTLQRASEWDYFGISSKAIGVVQGETFDELIECLNVYLKCATVFKIAISFDYKFYGKICPHQRKEYSYMYGRQWLMEQIRKLEPTKPIHLLGCALPQEGLFYQREGFEFISSIDTSNPVLHGMFNIPYQVYGLEMKNDAKMGDCMGTLISKDIEIRVFENIDKFKEFWK